MATKLYSRQGGNIQGMAIRQPMQPDTGMSKVLAGIAQTTQKLAQENYALGKSELMNSVIDNAYQTAIDNPAKFDELIKSNLQKSTEKLPTRWREEILTTIKPTVDATRAKVVQNNIDKLDKEHTANVLALSDTYKTRMEDANMLAMNAIVNGDREMLATAQAYNTNNARVLSKLGESKNAKDGYIIGDKATRDMLSSGQYNKIDTFKTVINEMDLESLKNFDTTTFQDRKGFMKAYGISDKTYESLDTYMKQRRKELGDDEKRTIIAQTQFNAARAVADFNEEELDSLNDEFLPKDFKKQIKKAHQKYTGKINPALADDAFLASVKSLESVIMNPQTSGEEHNKQLLELGVQVLDQLNQFAGASGMDDNKKAQLQRSLYESITSQEFADSMRGLYSDTKINELLTQGRERLMRSDVFGGYPTLREAVNDDFVFQKDPEIDRAMTQRGSLIVQEAFALAATGNYDAAKERLRTGNEELIRLNYSKIISEDTFKDLEFQLKYGKIKPTIERNGKIWEFQGYSQKEPLFKAKM